MPRRKLTFVPGNYYHIFNRGNNRQTIFLEQKNYLFFLRCIKKYLQPVVDVIAYCLMPTHYHLLVRVKALPQTSEVLETSEVSMSVSRAMQKLSISYTKAINKRFDRVGALFQGAFQAKWIRAYTHIQNLCIYIHANPVKDELVADIEGWPFSNYLEWLGEREGILVDREFIVQHFGGAQTYQKQVKTYIQTRNLPEDVINYVQTLES
jgi:REP element-mobilizing transposase RayT